MGNEFTPLTHDVNHLPQQTGLWFHYTGFRYKDYYDVITHNGDEYEKLRPNGEHFHGHGVNIHDYDVAYIRLVPDDRLNPDFELTGKDRIARNIEMFGPLITNTNPSYAPYQCAKPDFEKVMNCADSIRTGIITGAGTPGDVNEYDMYYATMVALYGDYYMEWEKK